MDRLDNDVDFYMSGQSDAPMVTTKEEGTPAISISAPASTSEPTGVSAMPPHPPTATTTNIIGIPYEFLQCLVEWRDKTTALLTKVESEHACYTIWANPSLSPNKFREC